MLHFAILLIILLIIFSATSKSLFELQDNTTKRAFMLCVFILWFLSAFKASIIGNDTFEYIRFYQLGDVSEFEESRYERGFIYYCAILYNICSNSQFFFIVSSSIMYYSYSKFIWKYSKMPWLSLVLFFVYCLFSFSMSGIRQSIAIAILFFSFDYVIRKKYLKFIISIFIAAQFHYSAIVFFVVPLLYYAKINRITFIVCFAIVVLFSLYSSYILEFGFSQFVQYEHYQDGDYFEGGARLASIVSLLLSLVFLCFAVYVFILSYNNENETELMDKQMMKLLIFIEVCNVVLCVFALKVNIIDRFALYFKVFEMILIPNTIININLRFRKLLTIVIVGILFSYQSYALIYRPNWNSIYPYHFCWEDTEELNENQLQRR